MYVIDKENTKDGWGPKVMQKRKSAETQVQQEISSESGSARMMDQQAWVPTREPMTSTQANALKLLAEELKDPEAFEPGLSKIEASRRIYRLQEQLRLGNLPPHTD